jgi:hypothetical protein
MTTNEEGIEQPVLALSLTANEARTLQKTIGIALDNVGRKLSRESKGSGIYNVAKQDYDALLAINAELSDAIRETL